jgi:hypothetical protein
MNESNRPILGVDVDGVLNLREAAPAQRLVAAGTLALPDGSAMPFPIGTPRRLSRLREAFDMVWVTTWGTRAHPALGDAFDLGPAWPVIDLAPALFTGALTWKLPAIDRWLADRAALGSFPPFAWMDDDLDVDAFEWANARSRVAPTVVVQIDPRTGLTDQHVELLLGWVREL